MTKKEIIKVLCEKYDYTPEELANSTYAELRKLFSEEKLEEENNLVDSHPNGRDFDAEDEDDL